MHLADGDRFREVEAEIRRRRSTLREVGDAKLLGKVPKKVIAMTKADDALRERRERRAKPTAARKAKEGENGSG